MSQRSLFKILVIWGCLILVTALLGRTSIAAGSGEAMAEFLNIGIGARAAAMGGAFSSAADDATASYWNPAGLVEVTNLQLALSHFSWYQDLSYEYLSMAYPASDRLTLGLAFSYMNYGDIEGYDQYDAPTGSINGTYDLATSFSAGYRVGEYFSLGSAVKYVVISLADQSASALAVDLGARYHTDLFAAAVTAINLGQKIKFDQIEENLPAGIRAGVSIRPLGSSFLAALEVENQFYGTMSVKNGFEWNYEGKYFIRTGYAYYPNQDEREFGQSLSFGVGALFGPARLDYTFSPQEKFSSENLHRFSVILDL
nr:PorV/PorQ family protein [candidate division Zixibacteria bacterium]